MITRDVVDKQIIAILIDDGSDGHCDGHEQITNYVMSLIEPLTKLLKESRRSHYHCDDFWFCCPECSHPDHFGSRPPVGARGCNCDADAWNKKIDDVLHGE